MRQSQCLFPSMSQRRGCPDGILDLPTVDIPHRKFPNLLSSEGHADLGQERIPNLRLGRRVEIVEVESDVNTRAKGIVNDLYSVGREEEDPAVVLEVTKAERMRVCKGQVIVLRISSTHKTATIAFRMRSWSERCSMNTSACRTIRHPHDPEFGTEIDLIDQDNRLP